MSVNIEDYCALDDSSFKLKMHELGYAVSIYVSTLVSYPNMTASLVIARPAMLSYAGEKDVRDFLLENVSGRKLIACNHYSMYGWMGEEFENNLEFITRSTARKFPPQVQKLFKYADKSSHTLSVMLGALFTYNDGHQENRKRLIESIGSGRDALDMGLELKLRGLYIPSYQISKPKRRKR